MLLRAISLDLQQQLEQKICQNRELEAQTQRLQLNVEEMKREIRALRHENLSLKQSNELVTQNEAQSITVHDSPSGKSQQQTASLKPDSQEESTSSTMESVKTRESSQNTNGKN